MQSGPQTLADASGENSPIRQSALQSAMSRKFSRGGERGTVAVGPRSSCAERAESRRHARLLRRRRAALSALLATGEIQRSSCSCDKSGTPLQSRQVDLGLRAVAPFCPSSASALLWARRLRCKDEFAPRLELVCETIASFQIARAVTCFPGGPVEKYNRRTSCGRELAHFAPRQACLRRSEELSST